MAALNNLRRFLVATVAGLAISLATNPATSSSPGGGADVASLLQQPPRLLGVQASALPPATGSTHIVGLRRESVPVYRRGKVASFKTSYSGILNVGSPPQEFRVVFDTGSGHIVLPASECKSEACLLHRRYNMTASTTSVAINSDGSVVPEGELCDQVTIGFGTGEITGEFTRDRVCFGTSPASDFEPADAVAAEAAGPIASTTPLCVEMSVVLAVQMSTHPFKTFHFDGILGLGLDGLTLNRNFSAFDMLIGSGNLGASHFGFFLTEGEDDEESEIAIGGHNADRFLEPLSWAPVAMADLGYWQIEITAVRIDGDLLDICKDGTCRGVVDTGTSHLGIPAPYDAQIAELLARPAGDILDCRLAMAPEIQIELRGYNLTLHPFNYMRRLPLREGVTVGSAQGVYLPSADTNATFTSAADPASTPQAPSTASPLQPTSSQPSEPVAAPTQPFVEQSADPISALAINTTAATARGITATHAAAAVPASPAAQAAVSSAPLARGAAEAEGGSSTGASAGSSGNAKEEVKRFCRPRLMPVRLPAPLGPKLFILGEPVLHRYYTVFDWGNKQVGFSLANNRRNTLGASAMTDQKGTLPKEVDMLLMQKTLGVTRDGGAPRRHSGEEVQEEAAMVQMRVRLNLRPQRV